MYGKVRYKFVLRYLIETTVVSVLTVVKRQIALSVSNNSWFYLQYTISVSDYIANTSHLFCRYLNHSKPIELLYVYTPIKDLED